MVLNCFFSQVQPSELSKQGLLFIWVLQDPSALVPGTFPPHSFHSAIPADLRVEVLLAFDLLPPSLNVASAHPSLTTMFKTQIRSHLILEDLSYKWPKGLLQGLHGKDTWNAWPKDGIQLLISCLPDGIFSYVGRA